MRKYLNYFIVFAIFGFVIESIYVGVNNLDYNSGFLHGPWTPVYGFGVLVAILVDNTFKVKKGLMRFLGLFIALSILITLVEYIGGMFIEYTFGKVFWGYSHHTFSIGKYASLEMMLLWGIIGTLFVYYGKSFVEKLIVKIPLCISVLIGAMMFGDFIYTLLTGL